MGKFNQDLHQFGSTKPANTGGSRDCAQCEAMLADALDGTLSPEEQAQFDCHMAGCTSCSTMLGDAQRGAAWLELLGTQRPEPPLALLERILAQTSGQTSGQTSNHVYTPGPGQLSMSPVATADGLTLPLPATSLLPARITKVLPFHSRVATALQTRSFSSRSLTSKPLTSWFLTSKSIGQTMLQPRLAMTAAMAFFSIGLTLNLTGVRLTDLRASDLRPSSLRRSFYQANAHVVRYYDNLRVVYELESRVRDLQRSSEGDVAPISPDSSNGPNSSETKPADDSKTGPKSGEPHPKQPRPRPGSGTSRRQRVAPAHPLEPPSLAALQLPDTPASLPQRPVYLSSAIASTSHTLNEGKPV